jgi:Tol biopolymer transport system component
VGWSNSNNGSLIPHFSPDGTKLIWAAMTQQSSDKVDSKTLFGTFQIRVADFVVGLFGVPSLTNIVNMNLPDGNFYEVYGFNQNGTRIVFCSSMNATSVWGSQIYSYNWQTQSDLRTLTTEGYSEHAYYTPDYKSLVYMTDVLTGLGVDLWIMDENGGNKQRLTYYNEWWHPMYYGGPLWPGGTSWNPFKSTQFIGGMFSFFFFFFFLLKIITFI